MHLTKKILRFARREAGQDLIEYTLLMAFIALAAAAIFTVAGAHSPQIKKFAADVVDHAHQTTKPTKDQLK